LKGAIEMNQLDALAIVYDLATENSMDRKLAIEYDLMEEFNQQQKALEIVYNMIESMRKNK
jgi:GH35 family endo-1,4-beta-xylanase